jgi:hypothetical protein
MMIWKAPWKVMSNIEFLLCRITISAAVGLRGPILTVLQNVC